MNLSTSEQQNIYMMLGLKDRIASIAASEKPHRYKGSTFHSVRLESSNFGLTFFEMKAKQV